MKKLYLFIIIIFSLTVLPVCAQTESLNEKISAFQQAKIVDNLGIVVPTVVEVPFNQENLLNHSFAVVEIESEKFQPYYFYQKNNFVDLNIELKSGQKAGKNLIDEDYKSSVDFLLPEEGQGEADILIKGRSAFISSSLIVNLDRNVSLPTMIEIKADDVVVYAKTKMTSQVVNFPETKARNWEVKMWYAQPLRITELDLRQKNEVSAETRGLRFLARPGMNYAVYFNSDRRVDIETGEAGNLQIDKDVLLTKTYITSKNSFYREADIDKDKVSDKIDNCVSVANPKQEDVDDNGRGDACDDFDRDGVINSLDNCIDQPNYDQRDTDADKIGDVCDNQENRLTERYPWLPWMGMAFVVLIIGAMTYSVWRDRKNK